MFEYSACRKGDYYRYLAEFKTGNEKKEAGDQSMKAYEVNFLYYCILFCILYQIWTYLPLVVLFPEFVKNMQCLLFLAIDLKGLFCTSFLIWPA